MLLGERVNALVLMLQQHTQAAINDDDEIRCIYPTDSPSAGLTTVSSTTLSITSEEHERSIKLQFQLLTPSPNSSFFTWLQVDARRLKTGVASQVGCRVWGLISVLTGTAATFSAFGRVSNVI